MIRRALFLPFLAIVLPAVATLTAAAQDRTVFVDYRVDGYRYFILRPSATPPRNWQTTAFDDARWNSGAASFGTTTLPNTPPCPLNDPAIVRTDWPQSRDLLVRRAITLPAGARSVRVAIAIDNNLQVFFNGVEISGGTLIHDVCAAPEDYVLQVPDSLLRAGTNVLAARGIWQSGQSYLDFRVTGIVSYTITATAGPNGTLTPAGSVTVQAGESQTFLIAPAAGYELDSLLVDGLPVDSTTSYTFANVTSDRTIRAVFKIRRYAVTATAGPYGSIAPAGTIFVNHGDSVTFSITPDLYYFIQDVVVDGVSAGTVPTHTFAGVTAPHTISASFFSTSVVVSSLADSGAGTFREAIAITNQDPDLDTIKFALPGTGVRSITLNSSLPVVIDSLVIDGTTQPFTFGLASSTESVPGPLIELNGNGVAEHGIIIMASNVTVRGLVINRCVESGILVMGADAVVEGNFLGTDPAGTIALGNAKEGIRVTGAPGTRIGGPGPGAGNLISGNGRNGVRIENAAGTVVAGNLIGTDRTGGTALGNGAEGIAVMTGSYGTQVGIGNTISGNGTAGVAVLGASGTVVRGNRIGTALNSALPIPNAGDGVLVDAAVSVPDMSTIGGTGAGNTIAFNAGNGVNVRMGTRTGISGNRITDNGHLGIDVGGDGLTPPGVTLAFAAFDLKTVGGIVSGAPHSAYTLEFYDNETPDPTGFGEGRTPLGTGTVTTDSTGTAQFYLPVTGPMDSYRFVTATLTDGAGATSEFSGALQSIAKVKIFGEHYVINTTFSGIPLHWAEGEATFQISNGVPATFHDAIVRGYTAWDSLPELRYWFDGVADSEVWGGPADGRNLAVWVTENWEELTGLDSTAVAVTRTRYNTVTGQITDADIAFDAEHFLWEVASGNESMHMDVENVTAHEAGHFGGLGDIYNPGDPGYLSVMGSGNEEVTMYGLIASGETAKRSLEDPDSVAIASLYALVPPSRVDLVLVFDPSAGYSITQGAFEPSRNSALELIPKMRAGDRLGVVLMPATVVLPLTVMGDSAGRAQAQAAIASLTAGGSSAIGAGLQTAQAQLDLAPLRSNTPAILLFSAGEEDAAPGALSILGPILNAQTRMFTLGFPGSFGQNLCNTLAETTGGRYYIAQDTTINQAVNEAWNALSAQQFSFFTVASSDTFANAPFPGISWQGPVERGSTSALPGIQWQGPSTLSLAGAPEAFAQAASYVLSLLPPGGGPLIDSAYVAANPGLGIRFFSGLTYQYFSFPYPLPGTWTLYVYQRSGPLQTEPVVLSITSVTDIVMETSFDQLSYAVDDPVAMTVTLSDGGIVAGGRHITGGGPITDAAVTAVVSPPGGAAPATVSFVHQGAGVYAGSFAGTALPGTYDVMFTAVGDTVQRTAAQSFFVVPEFDGRAVLLASRSVTLDAGAAVTSGDIIVNGERVNAFYELTLGGGASTPAGYAVKASDIFVNSGAIIRGDVAYNSMVNNGTVSGSLTSPLALPVLSALPPFKPATPGTTPVTVRTRKSLTLAAGAYADVNVEPSATLVLAGGVYHFRSLTVKSKARLLAAGPVEVRVLRGCNADNEAYFGPSQGSVVDPRRIVFYVGGADGESSTYPQAVTISPYGRVFANIYAPFGTVSLRQGGLAEGAFIGNNVVLGQDARMSLASAFAPGIGSVSHPWTLGPPEERGEDATVPLAWALNQNYPNPFNPATSIGYSVAAETPVTLTVYDVLGRAVRTLVSASQTAGSYQILWDGRNDLGQAVGSGMYYYRLEAGSFGATRKMVLLK